MAEFPETTATSETKITVLNNGPLLVEGDAVRLFDPAGRVYGLGGRTQVKLCRCGASSNKPFCDGSHNHHGFVDQPEARDLPPRKPV